MTVGKAVYVSERVYIDLLRLQGELQMKARKRLGMSKVVESLIEMARGKKKEGG